MVKACGRLLVTTLNPLKAATACFFVVVKNVLMASQNAPVLTTKYTFFFQCLTRYDFHSSFHSGIVHKLQSLFITKYEDLLLIGAAAVRKYTDNTLMEVNGI